ncbi:unnamed protein product [Adineta ricciae]|uniref:Uncharacterized protein n=2 Tax=Adineta ricciae TaxID=249248 RepID=A0A815T5V4_ADIRI|nr:unnamed protein product [Adineta ricciae]
MTSLCLSEWPSTWKIQENTRDQKFNFSQLAELNITSQQLYHWSAPIDIIESYQSYLNQLSTSNNISLSTKVFYNCTSSRFGPRCQYLFPFRTTQKLTSVYELIQGFYLERTDQRDALSCYSHLNCSFGSVLLCLDWNQICDGFIQCTDGVDEQDCWQMEMNQCKENEYRCRNGQCISSVFLDDNTFAIECLDHSDTKEKLYWDTVLRQLYDPQRPLFINEEVLTYNGTGHFGPFFRQRNRRYLFINHMISQPDKSMLRTCWFPLYCYLGFFNPSEYSCRHMCSEEHCQKTINESCPYMFHAPSAAIVFGHVYLAYTKQYIVQQKTWLNAPEYICYNEQLCGGFNPNQETIYFNNSLCRRVQDVLPRVISHPDGIEMIRQYIYQLSFYLSKCNTMPQNDATFCDNRTMYRCLNSSKCIAKIRIFDQFEDCDYGDDENMQKNILIHEICLTERSLTHFICPNTNKCISRKLLRDSKCDCGYLDAEQFICPDEDIIMKSIREIISFPTICNGFNDLNPILIDGQNYTDETECNQWMCNNAYTRCNGYWDCYDGADEVDCHEFLSGLNCTAHSFLCLSSITHKFVCLSIDKSNDGNIDCLGGTDEPHMCRYNTQTYGNGFYCKDQTTLSPICIQRQKMCATDQPCANKEMFYLCEMSSFPFFRDGVCDTGDFSYAGDANMKLCYLFRFTPRPDIVHFSLAQVKSIFMDEDKNLPLNGILINEMDSDISRSVCIHGVPLRVVFDINKLLLKTTCLCLPNYYGPHCQYQNQRVSFTMKLQTFSDSWHTQFILIVSLIDDTDQRTIHSYEQITYFPMQNCQTTFDIYLLYSNRPKNESNQYAIHIDIYEKLSLSYRGGFFIHIPFLFLPVQRIASLLNIPYKDYGMKNCFIDGCLHGECIRYFEDTNARTFCKCFKGWTGRLCTIEYQCHCSLDSLCHGISAHQRSICICPIDKWGPRCLISDTTCHLNNPCQNNGTCIPYDQHISPGNTFECICSKDFYGKRCEYSSFKLILTFSNDIDIPEAMLIHFVEVKHRQEPEKGITFKKIPITRNPVAIYWAGTVHITFVELFINQYYLIFLEEKYNQSNVIEKQLKLSDYCPHIRQVFNETLAKLHLIRRIKFYHFICRNYSRELSCFYDDIYVCFCVQFNNQRQANCLEFNHTLKRDCSGRSRCENGGQCLQDSTACPQTSMCICPSCFYGLQCEFTSNGHSLSLDAILGYHIQPFVSITQQPMIIKISVTLVMIITIIGALNGIFSLITFIQKDLKQTGCGIYLLAASITTLFNTTTFLNKFVILVVAQTTYITNILFLQIQCRSIDYLIRVGLNLDQWLNACIAVERAITVLKGIHFNKKKSVKISKYVIIVLIIVIISSNVVDPIHRRLVYIDNNDEKRIWCVLHYPSTVQKFNITVNIFHFCLPFIINFMSASIIIISSARLKSVVQSTSSYKEHFIEQFKQHRHLLVSSLLLFILGVPRLVIVFSGGCMKTNADAWWFLMGYFISFFPPMLNFVIFVIPSEVYVKQFRTTIKTYRDAIKRRLK